MRYRIALHSSEEGFSDYLSVVDEQLRDEDVREIEITV
jgi:hypothetical protein